MVLASALLSSSCRLRLHCRSSVALEDGHHLAYEATYGSEATVDQAAYESAEFWRQVADAVPGFHDAPELERYRGWVANLINRRPGECTTTETGQELLTQYIFPGLQDPEEVERTPFPVLAEVQDALERLAPTAQEELTALLRARPLIDDDAPELGYDDEEEDEEGGGEVWNRAAWYGWQFLALRDAKPWMPQTIRALEASVPLAHRFIGIARQRASCRGTLHSDRRNYLLSTLTGLDVPEGQCAVVVPGSGERVLRDGGVVLLDNTFKHYVYNDHPTLDRFVLMAEIWHPALTERERDAIGTTFAVKDRFTLTHLQQCPWGFSDDELMAAISSKQFKQLDFWRRCSFGLDATAAVEHHASIEA